MVREVLMLSLKLKPSQRLTQRPTPGYTTAAFTVTDTTTPHWPTAMLLTPTPTSTTTTDLDTSATMVRERPKPNQRPLLTPKPTHGCTTAAESMVTMDITMPHSPTPPTTTHSPTLLVAAETTRELLYLVLANEKNILLG